MKKFSFRFALIALFVFLSPSLSHAALIVLLDDPNDSLDPIIIQDGSAMDQTASHDGIVSFSGFVGLFNVLLTTGISTEDNHRAVLELSSFEVSGAPGTLNVYVTDTDYLVNASVFRSSYSGNSTSDGAIDFSFATDFTNQEFGGDPYYESHVDIRSGRRSFSGSQTITNLSTEDLFSLTIGAQVQHGSGIEQTQFNARSIAAVPLPGALLLFASAIFGFFGIRNRQ